MDLFNSIIAISDRYFEVIAGLVGILSMIVARLLDWYFPSEHHRRLKEEEKIEKVQEGKEDSNE